jgi:hypothetical protein
LEQDEEWKLIKRIPRIGDWIVFYQGKEGALRDEISGRITKYSPSWSLPAKVEDVKDKVVMVKCWPDKGRVRYLIAYIRVLEGTIPLPLQDLNLEHLTWETPRMLHHWSLTKAGRLVQP